MLGGGTGKIHHLLTDEIVERRLQPVACLYRPSCFALLNPHFMMFASTRRLALASIMSLQNAFVGDASHPLGSLSFSGCASDSRARRFTKQVAGKLIIATRRRYSACVSKSASTNISTVSSLA
jgi:hypothetical protein